MSYVRVGADPSLLLNATLATGVSRAATLEPPPIVGREVSFLVGRLRDISKHGQDTWQKYMDQLFTTTAVISRDLVSKWPPAVSGTIVMNRVPSSQRGDIYNKALAAGAQKAFMSWVMQKWPKPAPAAKTVQAISSQQYQALTPEQKAEREKADARAQAYAEGRIQEVTKTDAQGNKTTFVKDPESGQFVPKDTPAGQEAIDKAAGVAGGLLDKIPGGLITVAAAGGLVLFLVLRRK